MTQLSQPRQSRAAALGGRAVAGIRPLLWPQLRKLFGVFNVWLWVFVFFPTLLAGVYYFGIASNLYLSEAKFAESEPLAREALEFNRSKQPDDWQRFRAESLLGASLTGQKKYAEAEPLLLEGYQGMMERKDRIAVPDLYHLDLACEWIVKLYSDWGKPERAAEWRQRILTQKSKLRQNRS